MKRSSYNKDDKQPRGTVLDQLLGAKDNEFYKSYH